MPLGINTELHDLLVSSPPNLDRTPNAGREGETPAIQGCSPCEKSWSQTEFILRNGKRLIFAALVRVQDLRDGQSKFRQKGRCNDIAASEEIAFGVDVAG